MTILLEQHWQLKGDEVAIHVERNHAADGLWKHGTSWQQLQ
jgi:hypothetical protein